MAKHKNKMLKGQTARVKGYEEATSSRQSGIHKPGSQQLKKCGTGYRGKH